MSQPTTSTTGGQPDRSRSAGSAATTVFRTQPPGQSGATNGPAARTGSPTPTSAASGTATSARTAETIETGPQEFQAGPPARSGQSEARPAMRRTRKARLRVARVDPWSVMKTFFLFSIAGGIMACVAVGVVFTVIEGSGLFDSLDQMVTDVLGQPGDDTPFQVRDYLNFNRVMGVTAFLACIDVVILTALATLGSFLYNLSATMLGGFEVTLAED